MLHAEQIRDFALSLQEVEESTPFGEDILVYKTNNRMFLLLALDEMPVRINVKCDPQYAILLREQYPQAVLPGYHMNKIHWNTLVLDGTLSEQQVKQFIIDSYQLIRMSSKKKKR